ncbi:thioesterase family protein [Microbacterium sp. X-17]|uniref:acyl-CoA thioesterase n=1 Tax=Microbacterium sp. X-17 TaxID=3144404 RepID=UPI0031F51C45
MTERLHVPIPLRWGDLDANNHVNNTSMLRLLEEARIRAFWRPEKGETAPATAVLGLEASRSLASVIARQEIEYLRSVPYHRDPLDVQLWIGRLGGSSLEVCYEVFSPLGDAEQVLYARSTAVVVVVDAEAGTPVRLPAELRAAWAPLVGEPIVYTRGR